MKIQAAVTMSQLQQRLDVISHNIANSNTVGYKKNRSAFSSLLTREIENVKARENAVGRLTPDAIRTGVGARLGMNQLRLNLGTIMETGRDLDIALTNEKELIRVLAPTDTGEEVQYTRDGGLHLSANEDGSFTLTTKNGHPILSTVDTPIIINEPFTSIQLDDDGSVLLLDEANNLIGNAGQIGLSEVIRPEVLERVGQDYFKIPTNIAELGLNEAEIIAVVDDQTGAIQAKSLESSNVDMAEEMSDLMTTQRSYQMNARTVSMADQMDGLINQLR